MRILGRGCWGAAIAFWLAAPASGTSGLTLDWVTVGDPGNACDVQSEGCFGAVGSPYRISKHEVSNAQYVDFLNAVAKSDPNGLYNAHMSADPIGGITRDGSSGSFIYGAKAGRGELPVNYVSFWDSLRFANWLHNGQGIGAQDSSTTEDGAYTITAQGIAGDSITRNAGATVFLTSEDEWYKAAYYDAFSSQYFAYPTGSDSPTTCSSPTSAPNHANCDQPDLSVSGSYTGSASPYGSFDQGGNVWEWNEAIIADSFGSGRGIRGGAYDGPNDQLAAGDRIQFDPSTEQEFLGFRVATVPEPGTGGLLTLGLLGIAAARRRRR